MRTQDNRIAEWLERRNMTEECLAELLGVHKGTISRYCSGELLPGLVTAAWMAKALGCGVRELYPWLPSGCAGRNL